MATPDITSQGYCPLSTAIKRRQNNRRNDSLAIASITVSPLLSSVNFYELDEASTSRRSKKSRDLLLPSYNRYKTKLLIVGGLAEKNDDDGVSSDVVSPNF
ncbi:hypothetical protein V1477_019324 [Vespula maculifrons]|uniref:Uncharacterized protein n=4 Tax=Vespula TaxID=7451 RepID=A0A834MSB8_VESGE|nr:hypothetical protein HZH66_014573 [Vespula vulgaris]KAF7381183.1 hypothetical protein HZH68_016058 [Vespula germanica]KAF7392366.1 hypothetical protein H0235_017365 [Vespula pensylvanica]